MIKRRKGKYLSLLLVLGAGIFFSTVVARFAYHLEKEKIKSVFNDLAGYHYKYIEDMIGDAVSALESFGDLYAASISVERGEFDIFAQGILSREPYIFAFRWLQRVPVAQRLSFEESVRNEGLADFSIQEMDSSGKLIVAAAREEYFPILYNSISLLHKAQHKPVIGPDAASFPERWEAMRKARDTGKPALLNEATHILEENIKTASRIFLPIYRNGLAHDTPQERRDNLAGFVAMLYRLDQLIGSAIGNIPLAGIDMEIYEKGSGKRRLLYSHQERLSQGANEAYREGKFARNSPLVKSYSLKMADAEWEVVFTSSFYFLASHRIIVPWVILFMGILLSLALTGYLGSIIKRSAVIEALVEERTKQLRLANEFNERILGTIPFPMDIVDEEGNILFLNEKFKSIVGASSLKRKCWDVYKDDKKQCLNCPLRKGVNLLEIATIEVDGVLGGRAFIITHSGMIFQGKKAVLEVFHDITERKETEARFRESQRRFHETISNMNLLAVQLDMQGQITFVNEFLLKVTGWEREELIGQDWFKTCIPLERREDLRGKFYKFISDPAGAPVHYENTILTKEGKQRLIFWTNVYFRNHQGEVESVSSLGEDITERKILEATKDEFVSVVSHEVRTPLSIIKEGVSQVMEGLHGKVNEKQKHFLLLAVNNINRIARIVASLLDLSRIESGKVELNKEMFDLSALIEEYCAGLMPRIEKAGLKLKKQLPQHPVEIYADKDKIVQILNNIIGNSLKFTDKGYIEIGLIDEGEKIKCSVRDTGVGIDEENIGKVFNKFEQFGHRVDTRDRGVGLGLTITKGIIELHKGRIWIESEVKQGTTVVFEIPKYIERF